jgi:two-component system NtrC family sensor kinase
MARLVGNLLDLGRIEAGVDLQLELGEIPALVERVCTTLQPQANQKPLMLTYSLPPQGLPIVEADQALLQQALHNLVENAIKYTDPGGKVNVDVSLHGDNILFAIKDTGIGIAPVDQPRLFEKFYRGAQRETRKRQGSGLGLAIVKSVIERHNGKIWVDSQLGKGSTFSFSIPLRQPRRQNKGEKIPLD